MKCVWALALAVVVLTAGCACDCKDEMDKRRKQYGAPQEVSKYDSSGYSSERWWYWSKGISFTFSWGSNVSKCCEVSTYRFSPIKSGDEPEKDQAWLDRVLVDTEESEPASLVSPWR